MKHTSKTVLLKHFKERPSSVSIDWPVLQLKAIPELRLEKLFKNYEEFISVDGGEGLGEERAILFVNQDTEHWFSAHDTEHAKGVVFECQGTQAEDLVSAYQELLSLFSFDEKEIDWVSDFIVKSKDGAYREMPKLQRVH